MLAVLPLAAPTPARRRTPPNLWVPAHRGSLVCPGTREGAPPLTRFAAIIIVVARVAAPIVQHCALPDQTASGRVLSGADLGLRHFVPQLATKHGLSNGSLLGDLPFPELWNLIGLSFRSSSCLFASSFHLMAGSLLHSACSLVCSVYLLGLSLFSLPTPVGAQGFLN